jgi:CPA1 family monovalent cation:H+ antiporter
VHFIEHEFPVPISQQFQQQLKKKYELLIQEHTKELRRHKKAKRNDVVAETNSPDPLLNLQLEINKFQRALLLVLHKEGEFSDVVIRKLESDMDVDDLKLDQLLPNEEKIVST